MSEFEIAVVPGDGIGREVVPQAVRVLEATDADLDFVEAEAGDEVKDRTGAALPAVTRDLVTGTDATLFGAVGETAAEVILALRAEIDSFVNVRPARAYPGVDAVHPGTDLVILRENSEGVYSGIESRLTEDVATLTRVITQTASWRLAEFACDFVEDRGLDGFTLAHKDNVMQVTDGLFRDSVETVADERGVEAEPALMDALAMLLVLDPTEYDVIVCANLAGDVLSDLAAGLVGGLGLLPSANIGPERAIFEPVHGSAPDIAGTGVANPTAEILSGAMLLEFLGLEDEAGRVREATEAVLAEGPHTPDLGGEGTTSMVADAVIDHL